MAVNLASPLTAGDYCDFECGAGTMVDCDLVETLAITSAGITSGQHQHDLRMILPRGPHTTLNDVQTSWTTAYRIVRHSICEWFGQQYDPAKLARGTVSCFSVFV